MKKYKPTTLGEASEFFYVSIYVDSEFRGLHSIHRTPLEAIDEAEKMNEKEMECQIDWQ